MKYYLLCFACWIGVEASAQEASFSQAGVEARIQQLQLIYEEAVASKNLRKIMNLYEDDAVYLPFQHVILTGKNEIKKAWDRTFRADLLKFDLELISAEAHGDFIFEVGRTHAIFKLPNGQAPGEFKFLNVWRRQPDGNYKIFRATYNQWVQPKSVSN